MSFIQIIENNEVYKKILEDSFGGVMYNVANKDKYEAQEITKLRDQLSECERDEAGGIMQGVFSFLQS